MKIPPMEAGFFSMRTDMNN